MSKFTTHERCPDDFQIVTMRINERDDPHNHYDRNRERACPARITDRRKYIALVIIDMIKDLVNDFATTMNIRGRNHNV